MGKKPLLKKQVKTLRNNVRGKPLQELLLNLGVDLMLRSSDLLNLRVSDVISKSGTIKTEVKVKQKKTGKRTLSIPLSKKVWAILQESGDFTRRVSDCEELVGVTHMR